MNYNFQIEQELHFRSTWKYNLIVLLSLQEGLTCKMVFCCYSSLWAFHTDQLGAVSVCWTHFFFCSISSAWQCWIATLRPFKSSISVLREKESRALAVSTAAHCEQGRINAIMAWYHFLMGSKKDIRESVNNVNFLSLTLLVEQSKLCSVSRMEMVFFLPAANIEHMNQRVWFYCPTLEEILECFMPSNFSCVVNEILLLSEIPTKWFSSNRFTWISKRP